MASTIERERAYELPDRVRVPDLAGRAGIADVTDAASWSRRCVPPEPGR